MTTCALSPDPDRTVRNGFPFAELLAVLRERGIRIGMRDYLRVGKLISRWDGIDPHTFCSSLSCLLASDSAEATLIVQVFRELYETDDVSSAAVPLELPPELTPSSELPSTARPIVAPRFPWWWFAGAALVIAAVTGTVASLAVKPPSPPPIAASAAAEGAPSPPPAVPSPPQATDRSTAVRLAVLAAGAWSIGVVFVGNLWWRRDWARRARRAMLAAYSAPFDYSWSPDASLGLPPWAVEDMATVLGRTFPEDLPSRDLDVDGSLRLTLGDGGWPHFLFKQSVRPMAVFVLEDIARDMRPWQTRIDALLRRLSSQGIAIERWYFDRDPSIVFRERLGSALKLETVARHADAEALLILSNGSGLVGTPGALDWSLQRTLARWRRRTWLNPVSQPAEWHEELQHMPMGVWPMTPDGLIRAASEIAVGKAHSPSDAALVGDLPRRVTASDVAQMKRLASLTPNPTYDVIDSVRRRFCHDVPEEVMLHLFRAGDVGPTSVLPLDDAERLALATAEAQESPNRARAVRAFLLGLLSESEPPPDSAAHLRWELDQSMLALQQVDDPRAVVNAAEALKRLAASPIAAEVVGVMNLLSRARAIPAAAGRFLRASILNRAASGPSRGAPGMASSFPGRALLPLGPLVLAPLVAAVAGGLTIAFGYTTLTTVPHLDHAYVLRYVTQSTGAGALNISMGTDTSGVPRSVRLYRDAVATNTALDGTIEATLPLVDSDLGHYYQFRGQMSDGRLALSNWVWVPVPTRSNATAAPSAPDPGSAAAVGLPSPAIPERIATIITQQLGVDPNEVTRATDLARNLGADYLDRIELVQALEEEWGIEIPDDAVAKFKTVGDIVDYLDRNPRQTLSSPNQVAAPGQTQTLTVWSGPKESGIGKEFSSPYQLCATLPEGAGRITNIQFRLQGDRVCGDWARCSQASLDSRRVCWNFELQGHEEDRSSRRTSEGVLSVTYMQRPAVAQK